MDARVTSVRPRADEPEADGPDGAEEWLSTEISIDLETGDRADPFETVTADELSTQETPRLS